MNRYAIALLSFSLLTLGLSAQESVDRVSPAFFGPNAFQVPQMNAGARTTGDIEAVLAGDFILGHAGMKDHTEDIYMELHLPLFTDRVNLSFWGALYEWYDQSSDVLEYRGLDAASVSGKGSGAAAYFLSTDIQAVREGRYWPAVLLRVGMRTASEDNAFPLRRGYDAAGYFFDLSLGKSFGPVSLAASTGFLCWQTGTGTQNDAIQFGAKVSYNQEYIRVAAQYGGYWGWRHDGDFPQVLYLHMDLGPRKWYVKPYILYQHGFRDWPFDLFRVGVKADVDVFSLAAKKK